MEKRPIYLTRFCYSPMGTFGRLYVPEGFECFTVERPWANNARNESCIPEGRWRLVPTKYYAAEPDLPTYEVMVPGRSLIKIHPGNTMDDVLGCICPGTALGFLESRPHAGAKWGVLGSRNAFDWWWAACTRYQPTHLKVQFGYPGAPAMLPEQPPAPGGGS